MGNEASRPGEQFAGCEEDESRLRKIKRMDMRMQAKLRQGVQYNMKVVIRGSGSVGKTSLWRRLQGLSIRRNYSDDEIECATINWAPRSSSEVTKVDVWDSDSSTPSEEAYSKAHAVLLLVDPARSETIDYAVSELSKIPDECSVVILLNFKDLRAQDDERRKSVETAVFGMREDLAIFEASMVNCFGLALLYDYLALPFGRLKLAQQLAAARLSAARLDLCRAHLATAVVSHDYQTHLHALRTTPAIEEEEEDEEEPPPRRRSRGGSPSPTQPVEKDAPATPVDAQRIEEEVAPPQEAPQKQVQVVEQQQRRPKPALEAWLDEDDDEYVVASQQPLEDDDPPAVVDDDEFYGPTSYYGGDEGYSAGEAATAIRQTEDQPPPSSPIPESFFEDDASTDNELPRRREEEEEEEEKPAARRRRVVVDLADDEKDRRGAMSDAVMAAVEAARVAAIESGRPEEKPKKKKIGTTKKKSDKLTTKKKKKKKKRISTDDFATPTEIDQVEAFYADEDE